MTVVVLPWPAKELSPNARVHWATRARFTKAARETAWLCAIEARAPRLDEGTPLILTTTFLPPDRRAYDEDNLKARMKASYDGLSDALRVDDRHFKHNPVHIGNPVKGGEVRVKIEIAADYQRAASRTENAA